MYNTIRNLDIEGFRLITQGSSNPVLDLLMPWVTRFGSGWLYFFVGVALVLFLRKKKKIIGFLLLAGVSASYYFVAILKDLIARPRPSLVLENVNTLITAKHFTFPSGHTSMVFMAAFIIAAYFKWGFLLYPVAIAVAFSRVYIGVHYPSDVIVGGIIGLFLGYVIIKVAKTAGIFPEDAIQPNTI